MTTYECKLYPTAITPMKQNGEIDYDSLRTLFAAYARAKCEGVFAVCQSSEMFELTEAEKLELCTRSIELCKEFGIRCVVSGHTQDTISEQIAYLKQVEALHPNAVILVSNRLAQANETDDVLIANMQTILTALHLDTRLGIYECPHPYKRLLSEAVISAMIQSGRFDFIKDTCCRSDIIAARLRQTKGSSLRLYNANSATLYQSILDGAYGYSGVQLNITPELFTYFKDAVEAEPPRLKKARALASQISAISVIEYQNYPANAKYCLMKKCLITQATLRREASPLTESQKLELDAYLRQVDEYAARLLPRADVQMVFEAGCRFDQCHASTVLPLKNGDVLIAYFAGTHENADDVGIWLSRRIQGVWQLPRRIFKLNDTAHWNPVLFETGEGVRIYFKTGKKISSWHSYTALSQDGGETWSKATAMPEGETASGPVRTKPIRLADGAWLAPNSDETADVWLPRVDISLNDGRTFETLARIPVNLTRPLEDNYITGKGAIQPTLWESAPGHVHALLRTTCGMVFRSDSRDGGRNWCEAYDTELPNNNSGIDVVSFQNALYLVLNPVRGDWEVRTPLTVMRSLDNGLTFAHFTTLADQQFDTVFDDIAEFSYPAIAQDGTRLVSSFIWMRRSIGYACILQSKGESQ